jgi:CRISPR-associated protein Cst2
MYIGFLNKVNVASLNGAEGNGDNVTVIKKISDSKGNEFAYVSGQALRRYIKETLMQLGEKITEVNEKGEPTFKDEKGKQIELDGKGLEKYKEKVFKEFVDLDLFGYMFPKGGRRWSPVKVSPLISVLPYKGEMDYLTRKQKSTNDKKAGNIVQIEIDTLNFMRGNIVINIEHIGNEVDEYTYEITPILSDNEKKQRIDKLLDSIKYLNGGAKQARNLENIAPQFVIITKQKTGLPFLLNALTVDEEGNIDVETIKEALNNYEYDEVVIGINKGIFKNKEEVIKEFKNVTSVSEAIDKAKSFY